MPHPARNTLGTLIILAALFLETTPSRSAILADRDSDPVVLGGSELPSLLGVPPGRIVAFRFDSVWLQFPVQVDERAFVDFGTAYNTTPVGITTLAFTDANTFAGPDPDPSFDMNDELVFMAKDAGDRAPFSAPNPSGVLAGSRLELMIDDPLTGDNAFVYLFESDGSIAPGAGKDYVSYAFNLISGPYLTTYDTMNGPNPENSEAASLFYRIHFSDRWIRDGVQVLAGGATGVDILDRHKNLFAPGNCARSENTFSNGEGAFFVNKDGPVRAIRSYVGANSGPLTQRDHFFYERRHDIRTHLRVHAISGVMDFYDYSPAAAGLVYYNNLNTGGVVIDGVPEAVTAGPILWEMVSGSQGTLIHAHSLTTDIPNFGYTSYYLDDSTPSVTQCTGDAFAYGSSGLWIAQGIPNTDPSLGSHNILVSSRVEYYEGPNQTTALAGKRYNQAMTPLVLSIPTSATDRPDAPAFLLGQNFPNPFSADTEILFSLPAGAEGRIDIYDVSGRRVRSLFTGRGTGTVETIAWNGRDARGEKVPAGIYFYKLQSPHFTATRKMIVLR